MSAYVRSVTNDVPHNPLSWSTSCEVVNIYLNGFTQMTPDEVAKSVGAAAAAWGPDQVTCPTGTGDAGSGHPYFQIIPQFASGGTAPAAANDGNNTVVFIVDPAAWTQPGNALAYATVWKQPSGDIVDVDIEINATPGTLLGNLDPGAPPEQHDQAAIDLQELMTHEFGHFLGLAHTCVNGGFPDDGSSSPTGSMPVDAEGNPIPTCTDPVDSTDAVQAEAVMWWQIIPETTNKRVLSTDDARGICAIYPPTSVVPACTQNAPDDGCGCAAAGDKDGSLLAAAFGALALGVTRRRRRQT